MSSGVNDDLAVPSGRALVPVGGARPDPARIAVRPRPSAAFRAQLVATAPGAPQTRPRRRASPDHAATLYAAAGAKKAPPSAVKVSM
jgi:hypothetical protein